MIDQEITERMRVAIAWHLANNFIPSQPPELLEYCLQAIDACNTNDPTRSIQLPRGVTMTAGELVDDLRLNDMIAAENFEDVTILGNVQKALSLLTEADNLATELSGRGLLDYHKASAMATYFMRVLQPLRELIEYLESEAKWNEQKPSKQ